MVAVQPQGCSKSSNFPLGGAGVGGEESTDLPCQAWLVERGRSRELRRCSTNSGFPLGESGGRWEALQCVGARADDMEPSTGLCTEMLWVAKEAFHNGNFELAAKIYGSQLAELLQPEQDLCLHQGTC